MPFTPEQVDSMSQEEAEHRFHRRTNGEGVTPGYTYGWDGAGPGTDAPGVWSEWLRLLLWPDDYTPKGIRPYYADRELAIQGASSIGFTGPYGPTGEIVVKQTLAWNGA